MNPYEMTAPQLAAAQRGFLGDVLTAAWRVEERTVKPSLPSPAAARTFSGWVAVPSFSMVIR